MFLQGDFGGVQRDPRPNLHHKTRDPIKKGSGALSTASVGPTIGYPWTTKPDGLVADDLVEHGPLFLFLSSDAGFTTHWGEPRAWFSKFVVVLEKGTCGA